MRQFGGFILERNVAEPGESYYIFRQDGRYFTLNGKRQTIVLFRGNLERAKLCLRELNLTSLM